MNSYDEADLEYVVSYMSSGSSQLGLGDNVYFSPDLGEIVPKLTCKFDSIKSIKVQNVLYCVWNSNINSKVTISDEQVKRKTIDNMLVRQGVELNPGPNQVDKKFNLKLRTYNCNGLGNRDKMRRLFT